MGNCWIMMEANFVCLSITDEDPSQAGESKAASWYHTVVGGYYWAGAYVAEDYLLVGTDDGSAGYTAQTSRLLLLDNRTGEVLDSWEGLNGDVRSTVVYDAATNACYFTSKGGSFYSVQVSADRKLTNRWTLALDNGVGGVAMSTCSPVVYGGRAYIGVSGAGQFSAYSGHNITVIDLNSHTVAYRAETQGYPQTSGLLTTAYEASSCCVYVYFFDNILHPLAVLGVILRIHTNDGMEALTTGMHQAGNRKFQLLVHGILVGKAHRTSVAYKLCSGYDLRYCMLF